MAQEQFFIEGQSREINNFVNTISQGEIKGLREYAKEVIIDYLNEFVDYDTTQYNDLREYVVERMAEHYRNGGIELWYDRAKEYIAYWVIEDGVSILESEEVVMYHQYCNDKNVCMLHLAIVQQEVNDIMWELSELSIDTDIKEFIEVVDSL